MPARLSYPGVYIEEVPSGVRTLVGVATSIAAFLGRTSRGPVNEPVLINGFADFERTFGAIDKNLPLGYAVKDFFRNGGGQAVIVRLDKGGSASTITVGNLSLSAAAPGAWGRKLRVELDHVSDGVFHLTVRDTGRGLEERLRNLTIADGLRRVDTALAAESNLLRWSGTMPAAPADRPAVTADAVDAVTTAEADVVAKKKALQAAKLAHAPDSPEVTAATTALATAETAALTAETALGGSDSAPLDSATYVGSADTKTGLSALEKTDLFNLLCIPPDVRGGDTSAVVYQEALEYCVKRRAMLVVDPPAAWGANPATAASTAAAGLAGLGLAGLSARNAAIYFPRLLQADPLNEDRLDTFPPCGAMAGIMARTDAQRGVWKAPAGLDAAIAGIQGLQVVLTDLENGQLNPLGVNCLRAFPASGRVVWGARTMRGGDQAADEYKYLPVRRLALFLEESLYRGTQWVVFEPNDEPLWAQIRLNVGAFLHGLFRQGAFQGRTPAEAYFVQCDHQTTTQADINLGIVNIVVGFAPLKPAEFVVVKIQQIAGQIEA